MNDKEVTRVEGGQEFFADSGSRIQRGPKGK